MSDRWRFADLTREAARNVFGKGARLLPAVALAGLFGTASVATLVLEQHALYNEATELAAQGRGVVVFTEASADRPAQISRDSCESLVHTPGVEAAGLVIFMPGNDAAPAIVDAPTRRASSTLLPELGEADVVVGSTLASQEGPFRVLVHGQPFDAVVAGPSREGTGTAYSLTFPLLPSDDSAGVCIVVMDALIDADEITTTLGAELDVVGNPVTGTEVLNHPTDPLADYLTRHGRYVPLALGLIGGFITAIITRTRSNELAVYRLSGTSRGSLLILMTLEGLLIGGVAATTTAISALILTTHLFSSATAIVAGLSLAGTWVLVAVVPTLDIPFRRPTDLAKDR